jgi:hypothetical protein
MHCGQKETELSLLSAFIFIIIFIIITAIGFAPSGSSPAVVQTKAMK